MRQMRSNIQAGWSWIPKIRPGRKHYLVLSEMSIITRLHEVQCMVAAMQHCHDRSADHPMRFQRNLSWFEYVAQMAESMAAEWLVAIRLGIDYSPGITWDKSKADVGNNIEVKWSANPAGNLWIQDSDRHDRDIAVLVTGQQERMKIIGWIPVAIAKKPRYRNTSQNNWSVPQINLQPIETLQRSIHAHT